MSLNVVEVSDKFTKILRASVGTFELINQCLILSLMGRGVGRKRVSESFAKDC